MTRFLSFAALFSTLVLFAFGLTGCTVPTDDKPRANYAYKAYPPTILGVSTIQVVQEYVMPSREPNVEHLLTQPLPDAVAEWARARFQAGGADGNLIITIKEASIIGQDLPMTNGVKGWFTIDQSQRYQGKILVEFRLDGTATGSSGSGSVVVNRGQTVPENTSINGRDVIWTRSQEAMMADLDASTQRMLQNRLPFLLK